MGRHNASNGRAPDPTYDYDRWAPAHAGPRPCYGRQVGKPTHTPESFRQLVQTDPHHMPCGKVKNPGGYMRSDDAPPSSVRAALAEAGLT